MQIACIPQCCHPWCLLSTAIFPFIVFPSFTSISIACLFFSLHIRATTSPLLQQGHLAPIVFQHLSRQEWTKETADWWERLRNFSVQGMVLNCTLIPIPPSWMQWTVLYWVILHTFNPELTGQHGELLWLGRPELGTKFLWNHPGPENIVQM